MAVKVSSIKKKSPLQTFHVRYKNGDSVAVQAFTFHYQPKQGDLIKFFKSDTAENKQVLLFASEVASVIAYSYLVEAPLAIELQSQVKNLEARVSAIENNLADIVTRAVNTAFAQRGI